MSEEKIYAAIDLKSFYASVECRERNLDPLTTNLVVADVEHSEKTICLAVSPSLKAYGVKGRPRLFEVIQKVKEINYDRRVANHYRKLEAKSSNDVELRKHRELELDYIIAKPQMALYMKYSQKIYNTYLKYVSSEDVHIYSIDEVFIDITPYLAFYNVEAEEFVRMMIKNVLKETGITATAGIGTNLYLAKVAMDIVAKHKEADENGVRIAKLDEQSYKELLWSHQPITDFWRVGRGYKKRLEEYNMYTMGDVAKCSIENEDLLYKIFGVGAEFLIDHAWGYEPCTIKDIKGFKPSAKSICTSQVLHSPYSFEKCKLVIKEMLDQLSLDLIRKGFVSDELTLVLNYDVINLTDPNIANRYHGEVVIDNYGRRLPKHSRAVVHIEEYTSSASLLKDATLKVYEDIANHDLFIRKINITASHIENKGYQKPKKVEQFSLFEDAEDLSRKHDEEEAKRQKEMKSQKAMLKIKEKYGKNAILKAMNLEEGATAKERNEQIGGHRA